MDLEREMEALSREARQRLEAEREAEARLARSPKAADGELAEDEDEETGSGAGVGTKLLAIVGALVLLAVAWKLVLAPLVSVAITGAVILGLLWFVWKVVGGGARA